MNYFMKKENVEQYKSMIEDYNPMPVLDKLKGYLKNGDSILELGMGAGIDFKILSKDYSVIGTDNSPLFIDDYKMSYPDADVRVLDATSIVIENKFDCVYSNKVLQHLTKDMFVQSLKQQKNVLKNGGIVFMTLWYGEYREETMFDGDLLFTYYMEDDIREIVKDMFIVKVIERYTEMDDCDSLLVVLQKG